MSKFCSSSSSSWGDSLGSMGENIVSSVLCCCMSRLLCGRPRPGTRGKDGDDWKCRNVPGLLNPGVGGIASLTSCGGGLAPPGVRMVRPKLLGFRRGGVGGFTKDGESIVDLSSEGP